MSLLSSNPIGGDGVVVSSSPEVLNHETVETISVNSECEGKTAKIGNAILSSLTTSGMFLGQVTGVSNLLEGIQLIRAGEKSRGQRQLISGVMAVALTGWLVGYGVQLWGLNQYKTMPYPSENDLLEIREECSSEALKKSEEIIKAFVPRIHNYCEKETANSCAEVRGIYERFLFWGDRSGAINSTEGCRDFYSLRMREFETSDEIMNDTVEWCMEKSIRQIESDFDFYNRNLEHGRFSFLISAVYVLSLSFLLLKT